MVENRSDFAFQQSSRMSNNCLKPHVCKTIVRSRCEYIRKCPFIGLIHFWHFFWSWLSHCESEFIMILNFNKMYDFCISFRRLKMIISLSSPSASFFWPGSHIYFYSLHSCQPENVEMRDIFLNALIDYSPLSNCRGGLIIRGGRNSTSYW